MHICKYAGNSKQTHSSMFHKLSTFIGKYKLLLCSFNIVYTKSLYILLDMAWWCIVILVCKYDQDHLVWPVPICSLILIEGNDTTSIVLNVCVDGTLKNMIFIHIYFSLLWTNGWMQQMLLLCCTCVRQLLGSFYFLLKGLPI
jgi:hypothetical protein